MPKNENPLVSEDLSKLMLKFSIPCITSLLVSALYNIVDQIFIGRGVGYLGNGATNIVFPITVIALAVSLMIGDGAAAFISISLGSNEKKQANKTAGNAVVLNICLGILMMILYMLGRDQILTMFGATENNMALAQEYFNIVVLGIPFFMISASLGSIIRADGDPKFAMLSTLVGCIINVICDPIAIFVLHMGMTGAAIATILGQIVSALLAISYLFHTKALYLTKESFKPNPAIVGKFLPLGISSLLTQMSIVVTMGVMNNILVRYGAVSRFGADIPLAVFGILMKVFQIVIAFCVGIAVGCQPIMGFNYGAGRRDRVKQLFGLMMRVEIVISIIALILFEVFPANIIAIFGSESDLYTEFAVMMFRFYLCTIPFCLIQKATSIFLQSIGKPGMSLSLSLIRDFFISSIMIVVLAAQFGVTGAMWSAPVADVVSVIVAIVFVKMTFNAWKKEGVLDSHAASSVGGYAKEK